MKTKMGLMSLVVTGLALPIWAQSGQPIDPPPAQIGGTPSNEFSMARRSQKASDLIGKKVVNPQNEDLGKIEEIVVDAGNGRVLYGVLSFGGFLGMGDKLFAVPMNAMQLSGDEKTFILDVSKERLKQAEGFDKKHWPNFSDEQWATKTYEFYGRRPYWTSSTGNTAVSTNYRDRWNQRVTIWQKASDLMGKDVRNPQNEDLGHLSDLVVDPDGSRVMFGILSFRGKYFAIPWTALTLNSDYKNFVLNVSKDQLKDSVGFTKDTWPNMSDPRWAGTTFDYYGQPRYWEMR